MFAGPGMAALSVLGVCFVAECLLLKLSFPPGSVLFLYFLWLSFLSSSLAAALFGNFFLNFFIHLARFLYSQIYNLFIDIY